MVLRVGVCCSQPVLNSLATGGRVCFGCGRCGVRVARDSLALGWEGRP